MYLFVLKTSFQPISDTSLLTIDVGITCGMRDEDDNRDGNIDRAGAGDEADDKKSDLG